MRKACYTVLVALVLFVGLTTAYPCELSYPRVKRFVVSTFTVATLQADCEFGECKGGETVDVERDCNCFTGSNARGCKDQSCNVSWPGCGPAWMYSCNGIGADRGIFF